MSNLNNRGFSLAEILIAGVLLAGVTAGLLRAFTSIRSIISSQSTQAGASDLVSKKMEMLYEMVRQDWWADNTKPLGTAHTTNTILGNTIPYTVTSVNLTGGGVEDYRKVKITVPE